MFLCNMLSTIRFLCVEGFQKVIISGGGATKMLKSLGGIRVESLGGGLKFGGG